MIIFLLSSAKQTTRLFKMIVTVWHKENSANLSGSVFGRIPDGATISSGETLEAGFVHIEIRNNECLKFSEDVMVDNPAWQQWNTEQPTIFKSRKYTIDLDSPIQAHIVTAKHSLIHKHRAGKTIRRHLSSMVVPATEKGLIVHGH